MGTVTWLIATAAVLVLRWAAPELITIAGWLLAAGIAIGLLAWVVVPIFRRQH